MEGDEERAGMADHIIALAIQPREPASLPFASMSLRFARET